jgi:SecD/SecF fusion protein
MLRFMKPPKVNWMGKRKAFWAVSAVVVILGLAALVGQGSRVLGIEFAGGTRTVFRFQDDALIDGQLPSSTPVQEAFVSAASEKGYDLLAATAQIEQQEEPGQVDRLLGTYDTDGDGTITREEWTARDGSVEYWQKLMARSGLDADGNGSLSESELAEKPSRMFQLSTTESDMSRIKEIFNEVFGNDLEEQTALEYRIVKGETFDPLNLDIAPDGMTRITETQISSVMPTYRDTFRDYDDGVLLVVNLVDRPISVAELSDRLLTVREGHQPTRILPMETERSSHQFAVLVAPGEDLDLGGFAAFAERQMETLTAALERSESTDTLNVGPTVAKERAGLAIVAIILSWLVIIIYLWKRFGSVQWGLAAVICLIHDVVIVVGLVAVSGWIHDTFLGAALMIDSFKIDLPMIAAMLTVIGYSVNDTIVVFDRIRENRGKLSAVSFQTINNSINQTLPRTLLTSFTTFLVVLIMYVWGGPAIHPYNFALLGGILFGTYSSIAIASPLIVGFKQALVAKVAPTA